MNSIFRFFHFVWKRLQSNSRAKEQAWGCFWVLVIGIMSVSCSFLTMHVANDRSLQAAVIGWFVGFVVSILFFGIMAVAVDMTTALRQEVVAAWEEATHKDQK